MLKFQICVVLMCVGVGVLGVTQEQLAQYVAAQQTQQTPQRQPQLTRPRQAYSLQQAAEDEDDSAYQQAYQAAYQQAAAAYQPQAAAYQPQPSSAYQPQAAPAYQPQPQGAPAYQPQPQAAPSSYKSFSSSQGSAAPVYYRPSPAAAPVYQRVRPLPPGKPQEAEPEPDYDHNPAYQFSFDVKDDEFTNYQNRKEQREGDKISGSYSVVDSDGYIRTVTYTADPKEGFKAEVSREPTDIRVKLPQPPSALPQQYQQVGQPLVRKQTTQQYLEASSPALQSPQYASSPALQSPQYASRPQQSVAYVAPQFVAGPQYAQASPQYASKASLQAGPSYAGQHRLAAPARTKAAAIGYSSQQPTSSSPILYQAYQP